MFRSIVSLAIAVVALLSLNPGAMAHGDPVGPNGGRQTHAGPLHAELLIKGPELTINMYTMKDEPIPTDGGEATVTLLSSGRTERVALTPAGGNAFKGTASVEPGNDGKVVVSIRLADKGPVQARYDLSVPLER